MDHERLRNLNRLACASRILYDQRVLDLHLENEELQAKLTYYEYGPKMLDERLSLINSSRMGGVCHCESCFHSKRFNTHDGLDNFPMNIIFSEGDDGVIDHKECLIKKCLIKHARDLGLIVEILKMRHLEFITDYMGTGYTVEKNVAADNVPDICHIIIWINPNTSYWTLDYSISLSSNLQGNPMLKNIIKLFEIVGNAEQFFKDPISG